MKKGLALVLVLFTLFAVSGCTGDGTESSAPASSQAVSTGGSSNGSNPLSGKAYAIISKDDIKEREFTYKEGELTPAYIAEVLSGWTGMNFEVIYEINSEAKSVTLKWTGASTFATGSPPESANEDFSFHDAVSLRWFMLNTMCRSVRANMDNIDVYFLVEGGDMNNLELGTDFSPSIPFNKLTSDSIIQ